MKTRTLSVTSVLLCSILLAFSCRPSESHQDERRRVVLPAGEVHEGWYFAAGDQVVVEGTINGDAYVAGGMVVIDGTINGQLYVAGGQVDVSGTVTDRILGAGGLIRFAGNTGKSVTAAGGTVIVGKGATIGENFLAAGGNLQVYGTIDRDAKIGAGDVQIAGAINGSLDVAADRFTLYKGAKVSGNLNVTTKDTAKVTIAEGTVLGKTTLNIGAAEAKTHILGMSAGSFWLKIIFFLSLFATALLLAFVFPNQLASIGTTIVSRPGMSALWGLIALILVPIVVLLSFATIVGIPLGIFLLLLYVWFLYLSQLGLGVALADMMFRIGGKNGWRLFGAIALGLLIVLVLTFVPYLRMLVYLAGVVVGVGALVIITRDEFGAARSR